MKKIELESTEEPKASRKFFALKRSILIPSYLILLISIAGISVYFVNHKPVNKTLPSNVVTPSLLAQLRNRQTPLPIASPSKNNLSVGNASTVTSTNNYNPITQNSTSITSNASNIQNNGSSTNSVSGTNYSSSGIQSAAGVNSLGQPISSIQ